MNRLGVRYILGMLRAHVQDSSPEPAGSPVMQRIGYQTWCETLRLIWLWRSTG